MRWIDAARLVLFVFTTAAVLGCASWQENYDLIDSYGVESYQRAVRTMNEGDSGVAQASFDLSEDVERDGFSLEDLSPENVTETARDLIGLGPDRDLAKRLYGEAELIYQQAAGLQGSARSERFLEAADKYDQAAKRWPDSALEQDALFRTGECYFFADRYPDANDAYELLLKKHPHSHYLDHVEARRFKIAEFWLKLHKDERQSPFWVNVTDGRRPRYDTHGHALRIFDRIRIDDPTGDLADDATLAAGNANFTAGNFMKADQFYEDLRKTFPSSEHQFLAHLLGLKAKLKCYQGPDYSGDELDEAEELIEQIRRQFPAESAEHREYLARAYAEVRFNQAQRAWSRARYRDRRHEFGAARFYYDRLVRDFGDTPFAEESQQRLAELQGRPAVPPQRLSWLVDIFPDEDIAQPLIASPPSTSTRR